jgi:hypothetical protein
LAPQKKTPNGSSSFITQRSVVQIDPATIQNEHFSAVAKFGWRVNLTKWGEM